MEYSNYREVQRELKRVSPNIAKALRRDLKTYAGEIVAVARANASWSEKIPPSIVATSTATYAGVKVKGQPGPLYELGSSGNAAITGWRRMSVLFGFSRMPTVSGTIRHPLFGNRGHWYATPTRPFLMPAIDATQKTAVAKMERSVQAAIKAAGI